MASRFLEAGPGLYDRLVVLDPDLGTRRRLALHADLEEAEAPGRAVLVVIGLVGLLVYLPEVVHGLGLGCNEVGVLVLRVLDEGHIHLLLASTAIEHAMLGEEDDVGPLEHGHHVGLVDLLIVRRPDRIEELLVLRTGTKHVVQLLDGGKLGLIVGVIASDPGTVCFEARGGVLLDRPLLLLGVIVERLQAGGVLLVKITVVEDF